MHSGFLVALITVILFVVIYITCIKMRTSLAYCHIPGFYKSDADFCQSAELKSMHFYLNESDSTFGHTYPGYLLMEANQGIIVNEPVKVKITERWDKPKNWVPFNGVSFTKYYTLTFVDIQSEVLPKQLYMDYDIKTGKIQLYDKEKLWARLYKDNQITELCGSDKVCKKLVTE